MMREGVSNGKTLLQVVGGIERVVGGSRGCLGKGLKKKKKNNKKESNISFPPSPFPGQGKNRSRKTRKDIIKGGERDAKAYPHVQVRKKTHQRFNQGGSEEETEGGKKSRENIICKCRHPPK